MCNSHNWKYYHVNWAAHAYCRRCIACGKLQVPIFKSPALDVVVFWRTLPDWPRDTSPVWEWVLEAHVSFAYKYPDLLDSKLILAALGK